MNIASHYSKFVTKNFISNWKKVDIRHWLEANNVNFKQKMLKSELFDIVKQNRPENI